MIEATTAILWLLLVSVGVAALGLGERRLRLSRTAHRLEECAPQRSWGRDRERPPGAYALLRAMAGLAHQAQRGTRVVDASPAMRRWGRGLTLLALSSTLALVPFAASPGPLLDLGFGIPSIVFLCLLASLGQVVAALSERSLWARLEATRRVSRALAGIPLLVLALAPLVLWVGSLRLQDLALAQQGSIAPFAFAAVDPGLPALAWLDWLRLPRWLVFSQPIAALLFAPAMGLLLRRSGSAGGVAGMPCVGGRSLDADPVDLYWTRLESRLVRLLVASLFVALFLGSGGLPFSSPASVVEAIAPFYGKAIGEVVASGLQLGVFGAKLLVVLALAWLVRESSARLRDDQLLRLAARRGIPLGWANLLLMVALHLLDFGFEGAA